jgi:putative addiction module killer protein
MINEILQYQALSGKKPFGEWLLSLNDRNVLARILTRLDRLQLGHFGDAKKISAGVWELRFFFGPGYRIYFGLDGRSIVILLCGGDKSSQAGDIRRAQEYWQDYLRRK